MSTKQSSPSSHLLSRVQSWCGVRVVTADGIPTVLIHDRVIARLPTPDALEVALSGSLRDRFREEADFLPAGIWPLDDDARVIVDMNEPGGFEEAVRLLMNAYLMAEKPEARDWWLREDFLRADPGGKQLAEVVRQFRQDS